MIFGRLQLAYGSISFCQTVLHNLFLLYYIDVFVSVYRISQTAFWLGEGVFLLWNSVNDPLFGWLSDQSFLDAGLGTTNRSTDVVVRRIRTLAICGPLFAGAFLLFWFSWPWPGVHFVICLCLYDAFLTAIDLHHSGLLADLAITALNRTELEGACSVFSAAGTLSVFVSYAVWDKEHLAAFRWFCTILAVLAAVGFVTAAKVMRLVWESTRHDKKSDDLVLMSLSGRVSSSFEHLAEQRHERGQSSPLVYARQVYKHQNFLVFSGMNVVQCFHCHFNSNFFPLFLDHLLGGSVTPLARSLLLGVSFSMPHLNNLFFLWLCRRLGVYSVVRGLFAIKLALALLMLAAGPNNLIFLCLFIASNRVTTEGTCKLLNLVISDLVDEDFLLHQRSQPISALIFGTANLLSKPGQTLAPVLGTWLLALQTGRSLFLDETSDVRAIRLDDFGAVHQAGSLPAVSSTVMRQACFNLLVGVPIVCALIQLVFWHKFSLRGAKLQRIKYLREQRSRGIGVTREPV